MRVGLRPTTAPSTTTSSAPTNTRSRVAQSRWSDEKATSNFSVWSLSRGSGPWPPAGVIESTNGATTASGTSDTLLIGPSTFLIRSMMVCTMVVASMPVAWMPPVAAAMRVAWPALPPGAPQAPL